MNALINEANKVSSNLSTEKLISLLKQKIEETIMDDKSVVITVSNGSMECRNTIHIDTMEFDDNHLCLIDGDYELHINLDEIEMRHDSEYMDAPDVFVFRHENMETDMYFLG